ncbi:MAG: hypothetical protein WC915_05880 [archaeon]|jgi:ribosomal protein L34E
MVDTGKRTMKRKSRKTPSKTTREYFRGTNTNASCAITGVKLSGTKQSNKKSITQKRPSVPFGGVLSTKAREQVFTELGKVVAKIKTIDDVDQKYRKYVEQAIKRAE